MEYLTEWARKKEDYSCMEYFVCDQAAGASGRKITSRQVRGGKEQTKATRTLGMERKNRRKADFDK